MDLDRVGAEADRRSAETEALRRLPDDLAAMVVDTGLLRQWVPARYGGAEADVAAVLDAIEALAFHDGSTAWFAMIATSTALASGYLSEDWARTIYGDPRAVTAGFAMPTAAAIPVEGGLRVTGRWQWGSGTDHCTWIGGGCWVQDEHGERRPRADGLVAPFVFFARDQVELLDTWRVSGLKGTGSTDYAVADALVPEGRWVQFLDRAPMVDAPLYRFPFLGALALGVCAVGIGLARRAQHELVLIAEGKRPAQSRRVLAERPVVQMHVAQAEAGWRSARALVREVVAEAWEAAEQGAVPQEHRRRIRLAAANAAARAAEAVDLMYHAGGGSSIHESSALQRVFRDVHVLTQHGIVAERVFEPIGRMALGLPTDGSQL